MWISSCHNDIFALSGLFGSTALLPRCLVCFILHLIGLESVLWVQMEHIAACNLVDFHRSVSTFTEKWIDEIHAEGLRVLMHRIRAIAERIFKDIATVIQVDLFLSKSPGN